MGRAKTNAKRKGGYGKSAERKPAALGTGKGNGVTKMSGTERPQAYTHLPADIADPAARVIKTRN